MTSCLADLVCGRKPRYPRSTWLKFVVTKIGTEPDSPNRQEGANSCEVLWLIANKPPGWLGRVLDILTFEEWYHRARPFMANEAMTKEPVYATLHGRPPGIFGAVATEMGHSAAGPCFASARSQAARVALGLAVKPARRIVDHKKGAKEGCVLIGTAKPKTGLRYVAGAGQRSFVRAGKKVTGKVEFVDSITLPVTAAQILGQSYPRGREKDLADLYDGFLRRWPGLHPFGLSPDQVFAFVLLVANLTSASAARTVAGWLRAPSQPYRIDRYSSGGVVTRLVTEQASSTDELMIDAAYESGEIRWATCSDGVRSTQEDQESFEERDAYVCRKVGGTVEHRVAKPSGEIVWRVETTRDGRVIFSSGPSGQALPPTPQGAEPPPVAPEHCPIWMRWLGMC